MKQNLQQFEDSLEEIQPQSPKRLVGAPFSLSDVYTTGLEIIIVFNVPGTPPIQGDYSFTAMADGIPVTLGAPTVTSSTTINVPCSQIYLGQVSTLSYVAGNVTDSASKPNALASFSNFQIQNNSQVLSPPVFTEVVVNSDGLTVVATLRDYIGPLSSNGTGFTLQDGTNYYSLTLDSLTQNASIHTATITLTSNTTIYKGDTCQFLYSLGNLASGSYAVAANNDVTTVNNSTQIPAPSIASASIATDGFTFTLTFNSKATSLSGTLGFTINDSGTSTLNPFSSFTWSGNVATATSSIQIYRTDTVYLSYASSGNVVDNESNSLVPFSNLLISNGSLVAHPMVIAANPTIDVSGFIWSWSLTGGILPLSGTSGFVGKIGTTTCNLSNITISGNTYTASGSCQALQNQSAYISYSGTSVSDANGIGLITTTNQYVENDSTQDGTLFSQAPIITSATGGINSVVLSITPGVNNLTYNIYYSTSSTMPTTPLLTGVAIEPTITIPINIPGIYYFQVAGVNTISSALSNEVSSFISGTLLVQNYRETNSSTSLTFIGIPY